MTSRSGVSAKAEHVSAARQFRANIPANTDIRLPAEPNIANAAAQTNISVNVIYLNPAFIIILQGVLL